MKGLYGQLNYGVLNTGGGISDCSILQFPNINFFPSVGKENALYLDMSEDASYRWDVDESKYYCVGRDYNKISLIDGGGA